MMLRLISDGGRCRLIIMPLRSLSLESPTVDMLQLPPYSAVENLYPTPYRDYQGQIRI